MGYVINKLRLFIGKFGPFSGRGVFLGNADKWFGPLDVRCRDDIMVPLYLSSAQDCLFLPTCADGNDRLVEEIRRLPVDGCFVDVGANVGYYSALAARTLGVNGRVISVEPSEREFWRLGKTRFLNPHSAQWIIINAAISNSDYGLVALDTSVGHTGMNRLSTNATSSGRKDVVMATSLRKLADFAKLERIDLMKIDVEGFEFPVLQGAAELLRQRRIQKLVVEITDEYLKTAGSSKREVYDYMNDHGYTPLVNSNDWQYDEVFTAPN